MPSSGSFIPSSHKRAGLIQSRVLPLPRPCKLRFTQSPFQGKSVHLVAIFPMPLGSCFRHARPSPIYLNEEIYKIGHEWSHKSIFLKCSNSIEKMRCACAVLIARLRSQNTYCFFGPVPNDTLHVYLQC